MDSTKMIGKTIGEVEKLTGIPKRKLKYMIERNLIHPSQRSEAGFWLYSESDIQRVRIITLFQHLDYSEKDIRALLITPASRWMEELGQQIARLMEKRDHIEDQLFLAELLRYRNCIQAASSFSPTGSGIPLTWEISKKDALCRFLYQIFSEAQPDTPLYELSLLTCSSPDNPLTQVQVQRLCDMIWQRNTLTPTQLLLILRLAHTLSGIVPILEALLNTEGAVQFITDALQHFCEHQQKDL